MVLSRTGAFFAGATRRGAAIALAVMLAAARASAEPPRAPSVEASADKDRAAKRAVGLNDEAWALYEQGRYRAAIDKLEAAERLDPASRDLVYNLALIHEKLGNLGEAATHYRRFLEMERDPKTRIRVQAILKRLDGAQREQGEQGERDRGPQAAASPRVVTPSAPAEPAPMARPVRPWVIASGSFAGAAALLGSIFGLSALARNPGSGARTGDGVGIRDLQDDARVARSHAIVADVAFVIAAAAAGAATVLYIATPRAPSARVSLAPLALRVWF